MKNIDSQQGIIKKRVSRVFLCVLIVAVLAMANAGVWLWFIQHYNPYEKYQTEYSYIDFSRNFIGQEYYLSNLQPLRDSLNSYVATEKEKGNIVSIYFEYLNTGGNISINQDLRLLPASLNKLPVAVAVMKNVEDGKWQLDDKLVLSADDIDEKYGSLYREDPGTVFTIEYLLKALLQQSDNTALNIFLRNLDVRESYQVLDELGLQELFDRNGSITAKEYSRLFRALYTASFLNRESSQFLLDLLTQTHFNEFISQALPPDVPFAHKFGLNKDFRVYSDSGIIYLAHRPLLLTVLIQRTNGETEDDLLEVERMMKDITTAIYGYIQVN